MEQRQRQPKGVREGGQFTPALNAESMVKLDLQHSQVRTPGVVGGSLTIGTVLGSGVQVVPWVEGLYEENVVAQMWTKLWGDDTDCIGWTLRAFANILFERGVQCVTVDDIESIFDDDDLLKVAFRSDRSFDELLGDINDELKKVAAR